MIKSLIFHYSENKTVMAQIRKDENEVHGTRNNITGMLLVSKIVSFMFLPNNDDNSLSFLVENYSLLSFPQNII